MGPDPFIKVDMFSDVSKILKDVIQKNPNFSDACFNLARIQHERGRYAASKENWKNFLRLEPSSVFAKCIQSLYGKAVISGQYKNIPFEEKNPVKFGEIDAIAQKQLKDFNKQILKIGAIYCELYTLNDIQAIALDDVVEVVEAPVTVNIDLASLHSKYGNPVVTFKSISGKKTLLFKRFAVDVLDGIVNKVIHFEEKTFGLSSG
ncbi:TPR repeat-containing protein [Candidatus Magnetomorum sp. HK-1]|nr:TPR repeat-containing protein [Candidatus Magnetomorum sp. HK-1]